MQNNSAIYIRVTEGAFTGCGGYLYEVKKEKSIFKIWKGGALFTEVLGINQYEIVEPSSPTKVIWVQTISIPSPLIARKPLKKKFC